VLDGRAEWINLWAPFPWETADNAIDHKLCKPLHNLCYTKKNIMQRAAA